MSFTLRQQWVADEGGEEVVREEVVLAVRLQAVPRQVLLLEALVAAEDAVSADQ